MPHEAPRHATFLRIDGDAVSLDDLLPDVEAPLNVLALLRTLIDRLVIVDGAQLNGLLTRHYRVLIVITDRETNTDIGMIRT